MIFKCGRLLYSWKNDLHIQRQDHQFIQFYDIFYFIHVPYENKTFISSSLTSVLSIREGTKPFLCSLGCPASIRPNDLAMNRKLSICAQAYAFVFLKCAFSYPNLQNTILKNEKYVVFHPIESTGHIPQWQRSRNLEK